MKLVVSKNVLRVNVKGSIFYVNYIKGYKDKLSLI